MSLVESEMDILVGFRFKPTDDEIISLLKEKRLDPGLSVHTIKEIKKIYKYDPWELPGFSEIQSKEVWYFFCEAMGKRAERKTKWGFWKVTGRGSNMKAKGSRQVIGKKRILPFYCDVSDLKIANAKWVMHEISVKHDPRYKKDYVVCRLEKKPPNPRLVSNRNRVAEKTLLGSNRNHVAEKATLVFDRNLVAEKTYAESQIPPSPSLSLDSCSRNQVVDEEFNTHGGCNGVNIALQSSIHPEQDPSHFYGSSYVANSGDMGTEGCPSLNYLSFGQLPDDLLSSPKAFENESSPREHGQTYSSKSDECFPQATGQKFSPDFNSSKSDGEVYMADGSDMDTETLNAWVNELIWNENILQEHVL